jgi:hypothetical protein
MVSAKSSSADIISTRDGSSTSDGTKLARVAIAAISAVNCDLPCPGAPATITTLPSGK